MPDLSLNSLERYRYRGTIGQEGSNVVLTS